MSEVTSLNVPTDDGAQLHVAVTAGEDRTRPLAVLQHGFPDTPTTWRHLGPLLVAAGFRVATPFLRGYRPSTTGQHAPTIDRLASDLNAVHDALGGDGRALLVGHDWGAAAAWSAAADAPDRWRALVAIAIPPEPAMHRFLMRPGQLWRSRYMFRAQLPGMGHALHASQLRALRRLWRRWSPGYSPQPADVDGLAAALPTGADLAAALAPYRTMLVPGLLGQVPRRDGPLPTLPTLYLHGRDDGCIGAGLADRARGLIESANERSRVEVIGGVGHFLHLEAPDLVSAAVLAHLAAADGSSTG